MARRRPTDPPSPPIYGLSSPDRLGEMTLERWKTLAEQLVEGGALKPDSVDPAKAFDASFLPK